MRAAGAHPAQAPGHRSSGLRPGSGGPWGLGWPGARALARRPGDEQMRVEPAAGVDQMRAPVDRVVVEGLHQRPWVTVDVGALDDQPQRLTGPEAGARRQDLDVERDDLAARPELPLVGEDGLAGGGPLLVEFPVGGADPAQRDRSVLEDRVEGEADRV